MFGKVDLQGFHVRVLSRRITPVARGGAPVFNNGSCYLKLCPVSPTYKVSYPKKGVGFRGLGFFACCLGNGEVGLLKGAVL